MTRRNSRSAVTRLDSRSAATRSDSMFAVTRRDQDGASRHPLCRPPSDDSPSVARRDTHPTPPHLAAAAAAAAAAVPLLTGGHSPRVSPPHRGR